MNMMSWPMARSQPEEIGPYFAQIDLGSERILFWTIALVPLWWILGLQLLVYPLVGWFLLYRAWLRPIPIALPVGWHLWGLYTGVWILSLAFNILIGRSETGRTVTASGSILGIWLLTVIVWYAMRRLRIRYRVVVRALCIVGVAQLVAVLLGQAHIQLIGGILRTQSLVQMLMPTFKGDIFFTANLYGLDDIGWEVDPIPRLKSFYYWSPLAGTMSIFICMAAMAERNRWWQALAMLGGLITIWYSAARAGQVGVGMAILVALWFGRGLGRKLLIWGGVVMVPVIPLILVKLYDYFFNYRSDSASGRLALYHETYQAFLNSPLIGFGSYGRATTLNVPLGSHSQLLSTLYHTGVLGSGLLLAAWIGITVSLVRMVWRQPAVAPTLGAWVGLTLQMPSGELSAASVTVFSMAALLGSGWNYAEQLTMWSQQPWLRLSHPVEPNTPWERMHQWWQGTQHHANGGFGS